MRTVIIGGGLSGLAAAHRALELAKEKAEAHDVVVFESSARPGGAVASERVDGFLVERAGDGFITDKPAIVALAKRLGIESRLVKTLPAKQGSKVVKDGTLHAIPEGFTMLAPARLRPFLKSDVLSPAGKARVLAELFVPRGRTSEDESLASFVRRRFGGEVLDRLAQPLMSGIYGADPETLSLRATMPRFLDEEARSRSLTWAFWKRAHQSKDRAHGARYGLFASFDEGMQVLVDALVATLPEKALRTRCPVLAIERDDGKWRVRTKSYAITCERLVLAIPSHVAAGLVAKVDDVLARELREIPHGSVATVTLGFGGRVLGDLDAYGVVVPHAEKRDMMAATFLSRKWPNRAPANGELVRVFLKRAGVRTLAEATNDDLLRVALRELRDLVPIAADPALVRIVRWDDAMPQYVVGHLDRVKRIEARLASLPGLKIAGNSLHGVGMPDAVASGERAVSAGT